MPVRFVDLLKRHIALQEEVINGYKDVLACAFLMRPEQVQATLAHYHRTLAHYHRMLLMVERYS